MSMTKRRGMVDKARPSDAVATYPESIALLVRSSTRLKAVRLPRLKVLLSLRPANPADGGTSPWPPTTIEWAEEYLCCRGGNAVIVHPLGSPSSRSRASLAKPDPRQDGLAGTRV